MRSGKAGSRQEVRKMGADPINMEFFRNAGTVCLVVAAAAFLAAVGMYFAFDIPAIFRIRNGLAAGSSMRINACSAGYDGSVPDIPFRIVRTIIITDTDETIDLQDLFDGWT